MWIKRTFDETMVYTQVKQEIARANNLLSMFNHALLRGDDAYEGVLHSIHAPTLVIHGTDDTALLLNMVSHLLMKFLTQSY